jgi:shikimate kinase
MTTSIRRIFITGFMAAGKTTLASFLARRLDCPMVDLDQLIREREGRSPQQVIDEDGEARFRELETRALRAVLENEASSIVALGGGAWTVEQNRALIAERGGFTIWLDAPFELCWQRIGSAGDSRPLARDRERAERLYGERRALYGLADLRVQAAAERSAEDVAAEVEHALLHRRTEM